MNKFAPKGKVKVVAGTIVNPEYAGLKLILHPINDSGEANSKLSETLDKKWKKVKEETKGWYSSRVNFKQGEINTVAVQSDVWVINSLCKDKDNQFQMESLTSCLKKIVSIAKNEKASVHISMLLNEDYSDLSTVLENEVVNSGVNVSYYQETQ